MPSAAPASLRVSAAAVKRRKSESPDRRRPDYRIHVSDRPLEINDGPFRQQRGVPEKPTNDEAVAVCSKGRDYHPGGPSSMTFQAARDHSLSGHVTQANPPD